MEEKDVQRLLDMLYGMIDEAKSAAFSSEKCIINRDEALDLLDEVRAKLPLEIKKAQELVRAREEYVSAAKKEVEKMLRQAELDAKVIVSESETLQQARQRSSEIIRRAESRSKELYHVANTYTEDALRRTEEAIQMALDEVKETLEYGKRYGDFLSVKSASGGAQTYAVQIYDPAVKNDVAYDGTVLKFATVPQNVTLVGQAMQHDPLFVYTPRIWRTEHHDSGQSVYDEAVRRERRYAVYEGGIRKSGPVGNGSGCKRLCGLLAVGVQTGCVRGGQDAGEGRGGGFCRMALVER